MQSNRRFIKEYLKKLSIGFIILFVLFIGTVYLFFFIAHEVFWEKEDEVDQAIFSYLSTYIVSDRFTPFMKTITHFASSMFLQIAYAVLVVTYLFKQSWKRAMEIAAIGLGGYIVNYVMKPIFRRDRPAEPLVERLENFSFPSGHATSAFIFYGLLAYLIWKTDISNKYKYTIGALLILFSLLIGFSRVYLRVHYASDVLAGFCVGFAWLLLTISLFERLKKKSAKALHNQG